MHAARGIRGEVKKAIVAAAAQLKMPPGASRPSPALRGAGSRWAGPFSMASPGPTPLEGHHGLCIGLGAAHQLALGCDRATRPGRTLQPDVSSECPGVGFRRQGEGIDAAARCSQRPPSRFSIILHAPLGQDLASAGVCSRVRGCLSEMHPHELAGALQLKRLCSSHPLPSASRSQEAPEG